MPLSRGKLALAMAREAGCDYTSQAMRLVKLTLLIVAASSLSAVPQSEPQPAATMQYCTMKPGRPPLKYLSFNVTVRNDADRPQWFLFPASLYEKPQGAPANAGINAVELFTDPEHKVKLVNFMGTMKLQPEGAGGFKGVLLPPKAAVTIHGFGISFWGEPASLRMRVVVANKIMIDGEELSHWLGTDLVSAASADVKDLERARAAKSTPDSRELAVQIDRSGEFDIANALETRCPADQ